MANFEENTACAFQTEKDFDTQDRILKIKFTTKTSTYLPLLPVLKVSNNTWGVFLALWPLRG